MGVRKHRRKEGARPDSQVNPPLSTGTGAEGEQQPFRSHSNTKKLLHIHTISLTMNISDKLVNGLLQVSALSVQSFKETFQSPDAAVIYQESHEKEKSLHKDYQWYSLINYALSQINTPLFCKVDSQV